jgi:hypothetical protein
MNYRQSDVVLAAVRLTLKLTADEQWRGCPTGRDMCNPCWTTKIGSCCDGATWAVLTVAQNGPAVDDKPCILSLPA